MLAVIARGWGIGCFSSDACGIDVARETIFRQVMEDKPLLESGAGPDYLLWLDTDIIVSHDQIDKMLDFMESNPNADAASALYLKKVGNIPVIFDAEPDETCPPHFYRFKQAYKIPDKTGLIDGVGFGCIILRVDSLRNKLLPKYSDRRLFWFDTRKNLLEAKYVNGEDLNFCGLMKSAGMKLYLLPDIKVGHYGAVVGAPEHQFFGEQPHTHG